MSEAPHPPQPASKSRGCRRNSLAACPRGQRTAAPLPNDHWIEEVCCARGRIWNLSSKNGIGNPRRSLIPRIVWRKFLHLLAPSHPRLKLPWPRHHVLDVVTPSATPLSIEDDMRNCSLALINLMRSFKGDRHEAILHTATKAVVPANRLMANTNSESRFRIVICSVLDCSIERRGSERARRRFRGERERLAQTKKPGPPARLPPFFPQFPQLRGAIYMSKRGKSLAS
jgi:hypothetical protein